MIEVYWEDYGPRGGMIEVDPLDYAGMTRSEVFKSVYNKCMGDIKDVSSYGVVNLGRVVDEIMEAASDD